MDSRPVPGISTPSKQMIEEDVVTDAVAEVEVVEEVEVEEEFEADPPGVFLFDVTALEEVEEGVQAEAADVEADDVLEVEKPELELELEEVFCSDLKKPVNIFLCCFNSCACFNSFSDRKSVV